MAGLGEFALIERFFTRPGRGPRRVAVGIGDDCAVFTPRPGRALCVSTDMLVEGRHFVSTVAPDRLGHKALAVNLSDLAAGGATPLAFTLAIALPAADPAFLEPFSRGLFALADRFDCELAGGDTTRGPLTISITVFGEVAEGAAILRSGAREGDDIWVSGTLGDARLALEVLRGSLDVDGAVFARARQAMELPEPRVALGIALAGIASSAIDVSDGFGGDLGHVLAASKVGATVDADAVPRSADVAALPVALQRQFVLAGGDDYELVFTAAADRRDDIDAAAARAEVIVTRVGSIRRETGLRIVDSNGQVVVADLAGFDHFAR